METVTLSLPFDQLQSLYLKDYLQARGMELRVNTHRLDRLRELWKHETQLQEPEFAAFLRALGAKLAPSSRNRYRALFRTMMLWGSRQGLVTGQLERWNSLQLERENNQRTRRLSVGEEVQLLVLLSGNDQDIMVAALDTGLRKGALRQLTFQDVVDNTLVVPAAIQKHRQSQRIPLTSRLQGIIARRLTYSTLSAVSGPKLIFDFNGFDDRWKQAKKKAGLKDLHFHDLRGEMASRLSEGGVADSIISRLLGHSNLNTTLRYLRPRVVQFEDAIKVLETYHAK